jgi:chemotaxis protein methyltransferase CheR
VIRLSDRDFHQLSEEVYRYAGIHLTLPKKNLLEGRLQKRLTSLGLSSFDEYRKLLSSAAGTEEFVHMIDVVSTNKTDFFREPAHFDFMNRVALPEQVQQKGNKSIQIWCSACSTGEEPYTIAMVLQEAMQRLGMFEYKILATDISTRVLQSAKNAVYLKSKEHDIPSPLRHKYLLKSKDPAKDLIRFVPEIRQKVEFQRFNLISDELASNRVFDLIFCRNVLIYFDKPTQEKVVSRLLKRLKPGGYLLIGHSESLFHMNLPVRQIMPATFQKLQQTHEYYGKTH